MLDVITAFWQVVVNQCYLRHLCDKTILCPHHRDNARKQPPSAAIRRKAKQKIYEHQSAAHE